MNDKPNPTSSNTEKNYSWKGSPNAGKVLAVLAAIGALLVIFSGFSY